MKTANFPERKRQRRMRALERLKAWMGRKPLLREVAEAETLAARISQNSARDVRTKKDRSAHARFRAA